MSSHDESAIDAMVDEVMAGRAAEEALGAPTAAAESTPIENDQPRERPTLGFSEAQSNNGDDGDELDGADDEAVELDDIEQLRAERDGYLADSQRLAAEFSNYRKQADKRVADTAATQSAGLVRSLLPVLDACDSALDLDPESAVAPIRSALIGELERNGLELLAPTQNDAFDPEQHEAVMHEPAPDDSEHDGPIIGDVLRAGYLWKGRVVRPAMVRVVG